MKKILLSIASLAITMSVVAQSKSNVASESGYDFMEESHKNLISQSSVASTCDTLTALTSSSLTAPRSSNGYRYGNNSFGDKEKATFFAGSTYSLIASPKVTGVIVRFYKNGGRGTQGVLSHTVGLNLYSGISNTIAPNVIVMGSASATYSQILMSYTTAPGFLHTFDFATPVAVPTSGFFASLVLSTLAGDTAVISCQNKGLSKNLTWERDNNNNWLAVNSSSSWGDSTALAFFPKMCSTASLTNDFGLSKEVTIFPNPSSGIVNIAAILTEKTNLEVTVTNALGQVFIKNNYQHILNDLLELDMSALNNGVYFVTVSNQKEKIVKRISVSK